MAFEGEDRQLEITALQPKPIIQAMEVELPCLDRHEESEISVSEDEGRTKSHSEECSPLNEVPLIRKKFPFGCKCTKLKCDKRYCSCFKRGNSCGLGC
jgi:protein lin-54